MYYYFLLFKHLSNMHFITNGYKRFLETNSTDPRQRVPLNYSFQKGPYTHAQLHLRHNPRFQMADALTICFTDVFGKNFISTEAINISALALV